MSEKNKIILSIIIPVYNVEHYLKRCLDSLVGQLLKNMEVILIDDGSTDNSGMICDRYKEKYKSFIKVVHQQNAGLSSARNTGIEIACGEYLYFLDSDDFLYNKFIEIIYKHLIKHKYDIIEFKSYWLTEETDLHLKISENTYEKSRNELISEIVMGDIGCQIWLRVYKSTLFNNIRFPIGRSYEDIATYYKLADISKNNLFIDAQLHIYNILNVNSITKKVNVKSLSDMYTSTNEMCAELKANAYTYNINPIYLEYYKRKTYIYILLKLYRANLKKENLYKQIQVYLNNNKHYNYVKFRKYDVKRLFAYKMLSFFNKL